MEERASVDHVDLSFDVLQRSSRVEYVCYHEFGPEPVAIFEKLISKLDKLRLEIASIDVFGRSTVCYQLADRLAETARHVQQLLPLAKPSNNFVVLIALIETGFQKPELSDAWVLKDLPCF